MRENTYLVAALMLLAVLAAWAVREHVVPALRARAIAWPAAEVTVWAAANALVVVFLRPINQFIYFQF
jgi:hypothetical protein